MGEQGLELLPKEPLDISYIDTKYRATVSYVYYFIFQVLSWRMQVLPGKDFSNSSLEPGVPRKMAQGPPLRPLPTKAFQRIDSWV